MNPAAKPRILVLVHQYDNMGGVELHTRDLAAGLSDRYEVAVAYPHHEQIRLVQGGAVTTYAADPPVWPETPYRAPRTEQALGAILRAVRPDLVHVQHFLHWPLSVIDQAAAAGVPVIVSFHDYYAITPLFTMLGAADPAETFTAGYCLKAFGRDLTVYLQERRARLAASLARVQARVAVSPFLERQLARIFPASYRLIEYGIHSFERQQPAPRPGLRFGCIGSLIPQKGWRTVYDAFPEVRHRHPAAELHFYGAPVPPLPPRDGVTFHGGYRPGDLPRICGEFDVAVIPSLFAETFCLVLSEMWMAGLPVAASDIGALGERVRDGAGGKKFRPGDTGAITGALCWFAENDTWRTWQLPRPREHAAMVAEYDRLYRELLEGSSHLSPQAGREEEQAPLLIVQLCDFLDDGDRYYRYHLPSRQLSLLPGVTVLDCHYLHRHLPAAAEAADILVVQFIHDWELLALIERRRAAGKVTVFEANDYFFDVQPWNPVSERWRDRAVQESFTRFLKSADAVQTSSHALAWRWREFNDTVFVFENHLASVPPLAEPPARPLTIGWGGSPGHFADWFQVAPLLQQWLDAHPDVRLAVMTHDFARPFFTLPAERYLFTPFGSLADYLRFLGTLDIGLAPLLPTNYNRGRSDVKYLEYAAHGVPAIYADLEPYRDSVRHCETGMLYRTDEELLACLDRLATDAALRRRIRMQAHAHVAGRRLAEQHIGERLAAYRSLLRNPARGGPLPAAVLAAAEREGQYLRLRPEAAEETLAAVAQGPATPAAVEALARVVESHPGYLAALQHLAVYLNDLRDSSRALAILEQARRLDPRAARTLCELGRTHFLLGNAAAARTWLDEGLAFNPFYLPGWQYLLRLLALRPAADGPALAARARELFPACYGLHLVGAALLAPGDAATLLHQLLDAHAPTFTPEEMADAAAAFSDAVAQVAAAAPGAAVLALLRRACEVFPQSPRLADELARVLRLCGAKEESLTQFARAGKLRRTALYRRHEGPLDAGTLLWCQLAAHILRWTGRPP